jgi:putative DNA primase/helicase
MAAIGRSLMRRKLPAVWPPDSEAVKPKVVVARVAEPNATVPKPKAAEDSGDPVVLFAHAPYDIAKEFARREGSLGDVHVVWFWQGQWWRWNGKFYAAEDEALIRAQVYAFLDGAMKWTQQGQVRFQPQPRHVNDVLDCLRTGLALGAEYQPPMWLDTREPATDVVVFGNRAVNVVTGEPRELSPKLWVQSGLEFDWEPDAPCRVWLRFLDEVFPGDVAAQEFVEEWLGYCMTDETKFQKGALLIGEKRSGKGTICHVLERLVGSESYVGLSFNAWTAGENSREVLIGKRVGVFSDVRFKPGKWYGQNYDPGGISHVSAELLLNIIGEDTVSIGRKWKGAWRGRLRIKMMLISNEVPNLNDSSQVLPSRFVKLRFSESFFGREDVNLRSKLDAELPGIAARCVRAYQRLCKRGKFVQAQSAEVLEQDVLATSDPFTAMAMECFVPDAEGSVVKTLAYMRFEAWCQERGRHDLNRSVGNKDFGGRLRAVEGFERITDVPRPHGKPRCWWGMRLKPKTD